MIVFFFNFILSILLYNTVGQIMTANTAVYRQQKELWLEFQGKNIKVVIVKIAEKSKQLNSSFIGKKEFNDCENAQGLYYLIFSPDTKVNKIILKSHNKTFNLDGPFSAYRIPTSPRFTFFIKEDCRLDSIELFNESNKLILQITIQNYVKQLDSLPLFWDEKEALDISWDYLPDYVWAVE
jgi:hypothetical protein